jgi:hypothetical protein
MRTLWPSHTFGTKTCKLALIFTTHDDFACAYAIEGMVSKRKASINVSSEANNARNILSCSTFY